MLIFFAVALAAKKGSSISSKTLIIIIVSVLVALVFLSCSVYYLWRKYLTNKGEYHYIHMLKHSSEEIEQNKNWLVSFVDGLMSVNTPRSFHGHVQREEPLNADLPTIPLIWIQQSTNYFSEFSKLGEGGFGPVYKVSLNFGFSFKLCTVFLWLFLGLLISHFLSSFHCHSLSG